MSDAPNPEMDAMGYRCDGCGRLCKNPYADLSNIRAKGGVSCCPERKIVGVSDLIQQARAEAYAEGFASALRQVETYANCITGEKSETVKWFSKNCAGFKPNPCEVKE